jgi:hypothetical protein
VLIDERIDSVPYGKRQGNMILLSYRFQYRALAAAQRNCKSVTLPLPGRSLWHGVTALMHSSPQG